MAPEAGAQRVVQARSGMSPTRTPREAQCRPGLPLPAHGRAKEAEGPSPSPPRAWGAAAGPDRELQSDQGGRPWLLSAIKSEFTGSHEAVWPHLLSSMTSKKPCRE